MIGVGLGRESPLPSIMKFKNTNLGHIYFRGPPVVIGLFLVRCVYYTLICCV